MRLSTIKLSGFKSFVDPTTLHLPTNMTGVVGPNGCGKSNIIDAVRWVMGESSASRLRGDSITDVIFSGSNSRKPVSQATVELIFDNSDHTITGEFAAFNEISVKRTVSRDGASNYYLNGTRCRRRDITDLFLGTGLGPRSYSIIEQGMISKIIEARPEELRIYLEEAAGISKYKERRKETETRIRHTRENLERLSDLREEITKQLEHLKRQAKQAEQYQQLQEERKIKEAQWKAMEFHQLDQQLQQLRSGLDEEETRLQQLIAEQREAERYLETGRAQREDATDTLNQAQARVYQVGNTLARLEQQIQHQRDLSQRLQKDRDDALNALGELGQHLQTDQHQRNHLQEALDENEPQLQHLQEDSEFKQDALQDAEHQLAQWQPRWERYTQQASEVTRHAEVDRTKVDYLDRQLFEAQQRQHQLVEERESLDLDQLQRAFETLQAQHETQQLQVEELQHTLDSRKAGVQQLHDQQQHTQTELAQLRQTTQTVRGRLASLETLQQAALGQEQGSSLSTWLQQQGLQQAPRVGEVIQVEAGWETAVETVLGRWLEAVVVDAPTDFLSQLDTFQEGELRLVSSVVGNAGDNGHLGEVGETAGFPVHSLAHKVRAPWAIQQLLANVTTADDLQQAHSYIEKSQPHGSVVITRHGEQYSPHHLAIKRSNTEQQGTLLREREIQTLRQQIEALEERDLFLEEQLQQLREQLLAAEQHREETQRALYIAHRTASEYAGQLQSQQGKLDSAQQRLTRIETEIQQLQTHMAEYQQQASEVRGRLDSVIDKMAELEDLRHTLENERQRYIEERDECYEEARIARDAVHALALTVESQRTQLTALDHALERMNQQRGQLDLRLEELSVQLHNDDTPTDDLQQEYQIALEERVYAEQELTQARTALESIEHELRRFETTRQQRDQQSLNQRDTISQRRLDQQALVLKAEQLSHAVQEAGFVLNEVIEGLPANAQPKEWEQTVHQIEGKLRRLEPVNLAAIQEYGEASQRSEYLDAQDADLNSALETLEEAIRKIDRETRGRFKETFDRVNAGVQALYPRLFGGGHAYLELTGDDLLDTGVAIMARPPGKRVSSITLLSGGEKAMTAVALVFAIFQLNPAPFCLLDEVDAPLDEANVGRLAAMVKEMSEKVQFLFVSHNKATMEAAYQLSGVTMREPGVSRLVSVDLEEAARLAGAA